MQAEGMAYLIRNSIGANTESYQQGDEEHLAVRRHLDPVQVKQLQALAEANGWAVAGRSYGDDGFIAVVPEANEGG